MTDTTTREPSEWEDRWQGTRWEVYVNDVWRSLPSISMHPQMMLSAWNPGGRRLTLDVNEARDVVLLAEPQAMGVSHVRAQRRSRHGFWFENGW